MSLAQNVRFAIRLMRRRPAASAIAIAVLAFGIAGTTAVFSVVNAVLLRPLPYPEPSRLVDLSQLPRAGAGSVAPGPIRVSLDEIEAWRRASLSFASIGSFVLTQMPIYARGQALNPIIAAADPEFLPTLAIRPMLGSNFAGAGSAVRDNSALISHRLWVELFDGSPAVVGQTILISGNAYTVRGVLPAGFAMPRADASYFTHRPDLLIPVANIARQWGRTSFQWFAFGRLRPGVTPAVAQTELGALTTHMAVSDPSLTNVSIMVRGLQDATVASARPALLISLAISLVLFLIACVNVMNLQFAHSAAREHEIAVRQALGAGVRQLVAQLLTETSLLALAGVTLGVLLARLLLDGLLALWPTFLPFSGRVSLDWHVLGYAVFGACTATLLSGLAPALRLAWRHSAPAPAAARGSASRGLLRFQRSLMAAQVALGFALLAAAGLLAHSLATLDAIPAGFRTEGVLGLEVDFPSPTAASAAQFQATHAASVASIERMVSQTRALPGVVAAAWATVLPPAPRLGIFAPCRMTGIPATRAPRFCNTQAIGGGYFGTIGTPLLLGRDFTSADAAGTSPVAIINQAVARQYFGGANPLGVKIATIFDSQPRSIIGVVADAHDRGLAAAPYPTVYIPYRQSQLNYGVIVLRTSLPGGAIFPELRARLSRIAPQAALSNFTSVARELARSTDTPRFYAIVSVVCALLAVWFVGMGLFGVISFAVSQRAGEIGIRMALGAQPAQIRRVVVADALLLALAGLLAGGLLSALATDWLRALLFRVQPLDPLSLAVAAAVVLLLALLASYLPARRASRLDPLAALRE